MKFDGQCSVWSALAVKQASWLVTKGCGLWSKKGGAKIKPKGESARLHWGLYLLFSSKSVRQKPKMFPMTKFNGYDWPHPSIKSDSNSCDVFHKDSQISRVTCLWRCLFSNWYCLLVGQVMPTHHFWSNVSKVTSLWGHSLGVFSQMSLALSFLLSFTSLCQCLQCLFL